MTTYTAIPDASIDTDSPITESLMTLLRDNPIAITEGSSGAPKIQTAALEQTGGSEAVTSATIRSGAVDQTAIGSGAVHTSELDTSTANTSTTTITNFTLTGGTYVFMPQFRVDTGNGHAYGLSTSNGNVSVSNTSFATVMTMATNTAGNIYSQWRYVNTSPPHDMGDGDIPAFIYAVIDNTTGDIESISSAPDPVWLANGPTNTYPDLVDKTGKYKYVKNITDEIKSLPLVERKLAIAALVPEKVEITEELKHADKDIIPHPFTFNDLTGKTVIMLDPVSDVVRQLSEIEAAGEDIHDIIRGKYISIGNTQLKRVTPAGLLIPSTKWKAAK